MPPTEKGEDIRQRVASQRYPLRMGTVTVTHWGTVTLIGKFAGQVNPAAQRFTLRLSLGAMSA
jgi:hypothetical protein